MNYFLRTLSIFLLPLLLFFIPVLLLYYCGEIFIDVRNLARTNKEYVFGIAYSEIGRQFKFINIKERDQFEVIAIGSSRVQQFRQQMFDVSFYNASGVTQAVNEYEDFLRSLPKEKLPRYLLVGLDQWMFNYDYQKVYEDKGAPISWSDLSPVNRRLIQKTKNLCIDFASGKIKNIFKVTDREFVGITALVDSSGFRNDGSYVYQALIRKLMDKNDPFQQIKFKSSFERIEKNCCRFQYGDKVNLRSLATLDSLLTFCTKNKIEVIAFLPPFSTTVFRKMMASQNYKYISNLYSQIKPTFDKHGFELYDFTGFKKDLESNDEMMIDGYHAGEVITTYMMAEMLALGSKLNSISSIGRIESDLQKITNTYFLYEY